VNFFVTFLVYRRGFRGQRLVVHFIGDGVGFLGGILVIVVLVVFVLLGVECFLQLFQLRRLHERFGHCLNCLGAVFRFGLRFFVLGLGELFGIIDAAWGEGDAMKNYIDIPPRFGLKCL